MHSSCEIAAQEYFLNVYRMYKNEEAAGDAVDKPIDAARRSIQLNDKSANAHSLLTDLYGRKISLGDAMFAGPKFGPKVQAENTKAMASDDKNPHVWASLGREYLMTPKTFGGDIAKAKESFQKSLAVDLSQDGTWVWLSKAFQKQRDKTKARDASLHFLKLNPASQFALATATGLEKQGNSLACDFLDEAPTFLHSPKSQLFYFQLLPHSLAKALGGTPTLMP